MTNPIDATGELTRAAQGDAKAEETVISVTYDRLRELAARYLAHERPNHTLAPTALVHEAYLRLVDQSQVEGKDRLHFLGLAAREMRRVLIEHARGKRRVKRGGGWRRIRLEQIPFPTEEQGLEVLDVDRALQKLTSLNERQGRIVELRFFAGLTVNEVAALLETSPRTIEREWRAARAWLFRYLNDP